MGGVAEEMKELLLGILKAYETAGEAELAGKKLGQFLTARYGSVSEGKARSGNCRLSGRRLTGCKRIFMRISWPGPFRTALHCCSSRLSDVGFGCKSTYCFLPTPVVQWKSGRSASFIFSRGKSRHELCEPNFRYIHSNRALFQ